MFLGRLKLSTQLIVLVITTSLLTIGLLGSFWLVQTRTILQSEIDERASALLLATAELAAAPIAYGDLNSVERLLRTTVREDALEHVIVVNAAGQILASAGSKGATDEDQVRISDESRVALEAISTGRLVLHTHDAHTEIAVPVMQGGAPIAAISGQSSFEDAIGEVMDALPQMAAAGLAVELIACVLAVTLGRAVAAPLKQLAASAAAIGAGRLEAPPPIRSGGELGALGASFAHMVGELRAARAEVAEQQRTLERRVAERTAELEHTLAELQAADAERSQLSATIRELATPVLPVMEGILVMPLVGVIDSQRADELTSALLRGVQEHRARIVIIDVTGVPVVDTQVARVLISAAEAVKLLGGRPLLVGLRPELAQTIVGLGVDLAGIITRVDLQSGVEHARRLIAR